jgi:uncharacterized membrane protein
MPTYKERVGGDLDRWIGSGLVPAENRAAILQSIPDARRLDAAQTLAWVGAVLAGVALIAFIAANWQALPRLAQFAVVLGIYGGAAGGAAWCLAHERPGAANGLLTFAALAFAAAIGLTGQIFDIVGDERTALYAAGGAAAALALAGRASGPAIVALFFIAGGDFAAQGLLDNAAGDNFAWLFVAAPAATALAILWRSVPLAHGAAIAIVAAAIWLGFRLDAGAPVQLAFAAGLAAAAAAARWLRERGQPGAGVLYGWLVWAAMGFFMVGGWDQKDALAVTHRLAWLILGGGLVALGRHDRMAAVTALGVLSLMIGVSVLMYDLGLGLLTASAMFFVAAILAIVAGLMLRRRAKA